MTDDFDFKKHPFEKRVIESERIKSKFPDRIPIIVERYKKSKENVPFLDKHKYLVPFDMTFGQFVYVIMKRLYGKCNSEQSIFLFINGMIPCLTDNMQTLHNQHKDKDGFLYCTYTVQNTFG